ncbi:HAD family hydrolase, partial [Prochlorococcus sp. AH-716-J21]|nr:HAD family hydrolase [Prochlorococcus sp. AH-716-J21]
MLIRNLNDYQTFVFDCDGVILNSNKIKTDSFRKVLTPFGNIAAEKLIKYHVKNGGVSRYAKFKYFLDEIYPKFGKSITKPNFDDLLNNYG